MIDLRSDQISLRPIQQSDASRIFTYRSNPEIYRYQLWQPNSIEEVNEFINNGIVNEPNIPNTWFQLAICKNDNNELIGDCGIHFLERETDQIEFGITLDKDYQGYGYAFQALRMLFKYIFIDLHKHRIIASVDPRNIPSIKLLERMKMRKEAYFMESIKSGDQWVDDIVYAILDREWKCVQ